jgi:lipid-A-disaccharide synthase
MKYYIIAGEASGDLHGSNLIKELRGGDAEAVINAWGGDLMQAAGATLRKHYRDLAFMGFIEVVKNLRTILNNIAFCKKDIVAFKPDVIIFIDYPGFNLRIAKWAKSLNFKTFYYISPQIWAWHTSRVHSIKATIDRMFCILPFEKNFYKTYDYTVDYVGHPLVDVINKAIASGTATAFKKKNNLSDKPIIALLCGSRKQEVEMILPEMLKVIPQFPDYQFVIAGASTISPLFYHDIIQKIARNKHLGKGIFIVFNQTYDLLQNAEVALVKSGTSTLETALFGVPQVVCYKGNPISYAIAKRVVKVNYIALVNLIMEKEVVKELIQDELNEWNIDLALRQAIDNQAVIKKEYAQLRGVLGEGSASRRVAELMLKYLK